MTADNALVLGKNVGINSRSIPVEEFLLGKDTKLSKQFVYILYPLINLIICIIRSAIKRNFLLCNKKAFVISHIASAIHDRNEAIEWGEKSFDRSYINDFNRKLDRILKDGATHEGDVAGRYFEKDHKNLLSRLNKYRENYFRWITDFSIPVTNNLSERNLRPAKVKQNLTAPHIYTIENSRANMGQLLFILIVSAFSLAFDILRLRNIMRDVFILPAMWDILSTIHLFKFLVF